MVCMVCMEQSASWTSSLTLILCSADDSNVICLILLLTNILLHHCSVFNCVTAHYKFSLLVLLLLLWCLYNPFAIDRTIKLITKVNHSDFFLDMPDVQVSGWQMALWLMKEDWKSITVEFGERSAMIRLTILVPMLSAIVLDSGWY